MQDAAVDQLDRMHQTMWRRDTGAFHEGQEKGKGQLQEPEGDPCL